MSTIEFKIIPSVRSNDHQVRIIVDGVDLIAAVSDEFLRLD